MFPTIVLDGVFVVHEQRVRVGGRGRVEGKLDVVGTQEPEPGRVAQATGLTVLRGDDLR